MEGTKKHITIGKGALVMVLFLLLAACLLSLYPPQNEVTLYWMIPIQGLDAFW